MTTPNRVPQIVHALVQGLDYDPGQITLTAGRALEKAARELDALEALDFQVLRQARALWTACGETGALYAGQVCKVYPELERQHRAASSRARRLEAERLERHRVYNMSPLELSEYDASREHRH